MARPSNRLRNPLYSLNAIREEIRRLASEANESSAHRQRVVGLLSNYLFWPENGTVYDDLSMGFEGAKIPGANTPTWAAFQGNLSAYQFAVGDYLEPDATELMHRYRQGDNFELHVHWATNGVDGTDRYVRWEIEYTIANVDATDGVGDAFPATTIVANETIIPANTPTLTHMYTSINVVTGTGFLIGAIFKCRVRRIAAVGGAAPASDPFGLMAGIHIPCNTVGSKSVSTKY